MRKNPMTTVAKKAGTPAIGDNKADADMPANNGGTFPVKLGAGATSKFGHNVGPASSQGGSVQSKTGGKANLPAKNKSTTTLPLGTTKHAVGQVPSYLKGK